MIYWYRGDFGQDTIELRLTGFLGYPGRVGILPEITVIELEKAQA